MRCFIILRSRLSICLLLGICILSGCSTATYYRQAIGGQIDLLSAREPVARLLRDESLDPQLRARLELSQRMLHYVEQDLGLEVGKRYRSYVELDRDAVVVNLIATQALSIKPQQWCYPIAGCAPYRGYFDSKLAEREAHIYRDKGYTVYLSKAAAYSTLGWFDDPLLSTFIGWPEGELVALLAHEIAHSRVWVKSDVGFNESFAGFVGERAAAQWLGREAAEELVAYQQRRLAWRALTRLLIDLRSRLGDVYASDWPNTRKQDSANALYAQMRRCYLQRKAEYGAGRFDGYVERLNDAALAVMATYENLQPAFASLFAQAQGEWPAFFTLVDELAQLTKDERDAALAKLIQAKLIPTDLTPTQLDGSPEEEVAPEGDDHSADEIQCEAFTDHGVDAESITAVDNEIGSGRDR